MKNIKKIIALVLAIMSIMAIAIPAMAATQSGYYNTGAVNLRSTPNGDSMGLVSKNATCIILDSKTVKNVLWYQVTITSDTTNKKNLNGKTGWSQAQYITVTNGTAPTGTPQTKEEAFGDYNNIGKNCQGNSVRNVQKCMVWAKYLTESDVDGVFGQKTYEAVVKFQETHPAAVNYTYDGIVGKYTKQALWDIYGEDLKLYGVK